MEVATTTAVAQMETTLVPAIMDTDLTVTDTLVKVGKSWWVEIYWDVCTQHLYNYGLWNTEKYIIDTVNFGKLLVF